MLGVSDILNWAIFLSELYSDKDSPKKPAKRVWELLPQEIRISIEKYMEGNSDTEFYKLTLKSVNALNERILSRPDFYQEEPFKEVSIPEEVQKLLENQATPPADDIEKLNRLLMEAAYPHEIAKSEHIWTKLNGPLGLLLKGREAIGEGAEPRPDVPPLNDKDMASEEKLHEALDTMVLRLREAQKRLADDSQDDSKDGVRVL